MKTIKIIDLLNKIANGEELPKKIKHCGAVYKHIYFDIYKSHDYEDALSGDLLFADRLIIQEHLTDEVEILDEEDELEEFDTFPSFICNVGRVDESNIEEHIHTLFKQQTSLICNQKKIIERLKDKE